MRSSTFLNKAITCLFALILFGCSQLASKKRLPPTQTTFDANTLIVKDNGAAKKVCGQVLYLPIYSNIPYFKQDIKFNLSAFVAIHNTDFNNKMKITKVLFFDNNGKLVSNYLKKDSILQPLGATNFFVPEKDENGTGANFIVEWYSDTLINEPLIESVMIGLSSGQGVSFSSIGRIIRESN